MQPDYQWISFPLQTLLNNLQYQHNTTITNKTRWQSDNTPNLYFKGIRLESKLEWCQLSSLIFFVRSHKCEDRTMVTPWPLDFLPNPFNSSCINYPIIQHYTSSIWHHLSCNIIWPIKLANHKRKKKYFTLFYKLSTSIPTPSQTQFQILQSIGQQHYPIFNRSNLSPETVCYYSFFMVFFSTSTHLLW